MKVKTELEGTIVDGHANYFEVLDKNGGYHHVDVNPFGLPYGEMKAYIGRHVTIKTEVEVD